MADTERRSSVEKLVDEMEETVAKLHDQMRVLRPAVVGENPVGAAIAHFYALWQSRYQAKYTFSKIDAAHLKRLVRELGLEDLKVRITAYLQDSDPFIAKNRHPLNLFLSRLNVYAPSAVVTPLFSAERDEARAARDRRRETQAAEADDLASAIVAAMTDQERQQHRVEAIAEMKALGLWVQLSETQREKVLQDRVRMAVRERRSIAELRENLAWRKNDPPKEAKNS